jgi:hypothetical protein
MKKSSEEMLLCTKCITASPFADWIKQKCDFEIRHGQDRVVTVEVFAVHVDEFFRANYEIAGQEPYYAQESDDVAYQQRGSSLFEILSDELGSGLIDQSQKATAAAMQIADR